MYMPKEYTKEEREYIVRRLQEEAEKCLKLYGVKKTTVDELVKRVNIPKGTFYLFFKSKEELLFQVILNLHERMESEFLDSVRDLQGKPDIDQLTDLILKCILRVKDTCIVGIIGNGDMELLVRKLPSEMVASHLSHDNDNIDNFLQIINQNTNIGTKALGGAFRGIFFLLNHETEIGEENFIDSMRLLIRGMVMQMGGNE